MNIDKFLKYIEYARRNIDIDKLKRELFKHIEKERDAGMHRIGMKIANMVYEYLKEKGFSDLTIKDESDEEFIKFRVESNEIVVYISEENYSWPEVFPKYY